MRQRKEKVFDLIGRGNILQKHIQVKGIKKFVKVRLDYKRLG